MLVNKIHYKNYPTIELPKEIYLPDNEEEINHWHIYDMIINEWKKDCEALKILNVFFEDLYVNNYGIHDTKLTEEEFYMLQSWSNDNPNWRVYITREELKNDK